MFNLRYHIASLVAVFLALSIGLLLGTVVVERGALTGQATQIVQDLQKEFDDLRKDNADLRAGLERDRLFAAEAVPAIVSGALSEKAVLVVTDTGRADTLAATVEAITYAGGVPVVMTCENPAFGVGEIDEQALAVALAESAALVEGSEPTGTIAAGADMATLVAEALARELTIGGTVRPVLGLLVSSGQVEVDGITDEVLVSGVALLATWDDQADPGTVGLAQAIARTGLPAVGVESASKVTGVVDACTTAGLSAVDDVTSAQGSVSLVWLLSARASGYYGLRDGAIAVYPTLSVPAE